MNYEKIFDILKNRRQSDFKVEYKDEDGDWWELFADQPIRMVYEYKIRIVKK